MDQVMSVTNEVQRKIEELQEKLRWSEEERLRLQWKYEVVVKAKESEKSMRLSFIRQKYYSYVKDDGQSNGRNESILEAMKRIETRANMLTAKTDRLKLLRHHCENYIKNYYPRSKSRYLPSHLGVYPIDDLIKSHSSGDNGIAPVDKIRIQPFPSPSYSPGSLFSDYITGKQGKVKSSRIPNANDEVDELWNRTQRISTPTISDKSTDLFIHRDVSLIPFNGSHAGIIHAPLKDLTSETTRRIGNLSSENVSTFLNKSCDTIPNCESYNFKNRFEDGSSIKRTEVGQFSGLTGLGTESSDLQSRINLDPKTLVNKTGVNVNYSEQNKGASSSSIDRKNVSKEYKEITSDGIGEGDADIQLPRGEMKNEYETNSKPRAIIRKDLYPNKDGIVLSDHVESEKIITYDRPSAPNKNGTLDRKLVDEPFSKIEDNQLKEVPEINNGTTGVNIKMVEEYIEAQPSLEEHNNNNFNNYKITSNSKEDDTYENITDHFDVNPESLADVNTPVQLNANNKVDAKNILYPEQYDISNQDQFYYPDEFNDYGMCENNYTEENGQILLPGEVSGQYGNEGHLNNNIQESSAYSENTRVYSEMADIQQDVSIPHEKTPFEQNESLPIEECLQFSQEQTLELYPEEMVEQFYRQKRAEEYAEEVPAEFVNFNNANEAISTKIVVPEGNEYIAAVNSNAIGEFKKIQGNDENVLHYKDTEKSSNEEGPVLMTVDSRNVNENIEQRMEHRSDAGLNNSSQQNKNHMENIGPILAMDVSSKSEVMSIENENIVESNISTEELDDEKIQSTALKQNTVEEMHDQARKVSEIETSNDIVHSLVMEKNLEDLKVSKTEVIAKSNIDTPFIMEKEPNKTPVISDRESNELKKESGAHNTEELNLVDSKIINKAEISTGIKNPLVSKLKDETEGIENLKPAEEYSDHEEDRKREDSLLKKNYEKNVTADKNNYIENVGDSSLNTKLQNADDIKISADNQFENENVESLIQVNTDDKNENVETLPQAENKDKNDSIITKPPYDNKEQQNQNNKIQNNSGLTEAVKNEHLESGKDLSAENSATKKTELLNTVTLNQNSAETPQKNIESTDAQEDYPNQEDYENAQLLTDSRLEKHDKIEIETQGEIYPGSVTGTLPDVEYYNESYNYLDNSQDPSYVQPNYLYAGDYQSNQESLNERFEDEQDSQLKVEPKYYTEMAANPLQGPPGYTHDDSYNNQDETKNQNYAQEGYEYTETYEINPNIPDGGYEGQEIDVKQPVYSDIMPDHTMDPQYNHQDSYRYQESVDPDYDKNVYRYEDNKEATYPGNISDTVSNQQYDHPDSYIYAESALSSGYAQDYLYGGNKNPPGEYVNEEAYNYPAEGENYIPQEGENYIYDSTYEENQNQLYMQNLPYDQTNPQDMNYKGQECEFEDTHSKSNDGLTRNYSEPGTRPKQGGPTN